MTAPTRSDVSYDPYDVEIDADPYPVYQRLREEAPLYRNDEHDFYALSRFADVEAGLVDRETYISSRGAILELIKADIEMPPGVLIFEDPPIHTMHRGLLSRVFTPRRMAALEPQIRRFCAAALDPLVDAGGFDFVGDLGAQMPMRVIGMLLGIPEQDQEAIRDRSHAEPRTKPGQPMEYSQGQIATGEDFAEYVDWRAEHPSDDLMTDLLHAEFEDETGTTRRLTRGGADLRQRGGGRRQRHHDPVDRLGGQGLADHPDQRRDLVENRSLVPNAIEELLRYEPPLPRGPLHDPEVELHGRTVPEGSVMLFLIGVANRDDRRNPDGDRFDIRRDSVQHLTFGHGIHFCLGPPWPAWKDESPWTRFSSGSPNGTSTWTTPDWRPHPPCGDGRRCRSSPGERGGRALPHPRRRLGPGGPARPPGADPPRSRPRGDRRPHRHQRRREVDPDERGGGFVPATGTIEVLGHDAAKLSAPRRAGLGSGRTFQGADLFADLTVLETVQVSLEARGRTTLPATVLWLPSARRLERSKRTEADELIALFGLGPYQDHFIDELSTGHAASSSWRA